MTPSIYPEYLQHHYMITCMMFILWGLIFWYGRKIPEAEKTRFGYILIGICILQEIVDYWVRVQGAESGLYNFRLTKELPLQPCHFAYFASMLAIYTRKESFFHIGYFFGMSGAFMGILTPGEDGIYSLTSNLTSHFQHSLIIVNLMWCISALHMRATKRSIVHALIVLNVLILPISIYNYFTGENYFFLSQAPQTIIYNPIFPISSWPWYILWIEMIFIPYCYLFYLPIRKD